MPKKIINLPLAKVLKAANKAFAAGKLQFQTHEPGSGGCTYTKICVIGSAMTPSERRLCDGGVGISSYVGALIDKGRIKTDNRDALVELQDIHDSLAEMLSKEDYVLNLKKFKRRLDPAFWERRAKRSA